MLINKSIDKKLRRVISGSIKMYVLFTIAFLNSCTKFVTVPPPKTELVTETVFSDDASAQAAMNGIYISMMNNSESGNGSSYCKYLGLYTDELDNYSTNPQQSEFYLNSLTASNNLCANFWLRYSYVYKANAILEGIANSSLSSSVKTELEGEAKFIRAFNNFYLVNLFGDIPLITSSDYQQNAIVSRSTRAEVYENILQDLNDAKKLLKQDYSVSNGERIRPNAWAATALLARVYLFLGDWAEAANESESIINDSNDFQLVNDLNSVFLANSQEAIWQLMPVVPEQNTWEAAIFILSSSPRNVAISPNLISAFEPGDKRRSSWIDSIDASGSIFYYPFKYKVTLSTPASEYEMVLRLGEQYLIRAEANFHLGNLDNAKADLNTIRERAGLLDINSTNPDIINAAIQKERQVEMFTEWGDRWFTLKRTQMAGTVLGPIKGSVWKDTDTLLPIPTAQLANDPNIKQNPGY